MENITPKEKAIYDLLSKILKEEFTNRDLTSFFTEDENEFKVDFRFTRTFNKKLINEYLNK